MQADPEGEVRMTEELVRATIRRESGTDVQRSLVRLGLANSRLKTALRMVEWGGPDTDGRGPCPACSRFPGQGHAPECFLDAALQPHDAITHAEVTLRIIQDLLRHGTMQDSINTMQFMLQDLQKALDYAVEKLGRV